MVTGWLLAGGSGSRGSKRACLETGGRGRQSFAAISPSPEAGAVTWPRAAATSSEAL